MTRRISGASFDTTLMGAMVHVEKASLSITDNSAVAQTRGIPDGYVDGDVSAELEFELDTKNLKLLADAAKRAGSWRGIEPDDVLFYADTGSDQMKVEAFWREAAGLRPARRRSQGRQQERAQGERLYDLPRFCSPQWRAVPLQGRHPPPAGLRGSSGRYRPRQPTRRPHAGRQPGQTGGQGRYRGMSLHQCEECDDPIPEARRHHVPGVRLCVPCQTRLERLAR